MQQDIFGIFAAGDYVTAVQKWRKKKYTENWLIPQRLFRSKQWLE